MIRLAPRGARIETASLVDDTGTPTDIPRPEGLTMLWWNPERIAAGCGSCMKVAMVLTSLTQWGVATYGVTTSTPSRNAEIAVFAFEDRLRVLQASDDVADQFGVLRPAGSPWAGTVHRAAFLLDSDGTVLDNWMVHHPKPFFDDLFRTLHVRIEERRAPEAPVSPFRRLLRKVT